MLQAYLSLHTLTQSLIPELERLHAAQKKLQEARSTYAEKEGSSTHKLSLEKTLFIEEHFLRRLKLLAKKTEQRFDQAQECVEAEVPLSPVEQAEMGNIIILLEAIQKKLPENLHDKRIDTLNTIETTLREIALLAKKFYEEEKYARTLAASIHARKIGPLLRKIFDHSYQKAGVLVYPLRLRELRELEREANELNVFRNTRFGVTWTCWWRDTQRFERDAKTSLREPHVNVTIKLQGEKKSIHLIAA